MKKSEENLVQTHVEDYSQILPIFIYPDEQSSQAMAADMDAVVEKCSEVIERHSIYIRRKEHVKWIDDSYFLIGKAQLYEKKFIQSKETFLYVYQAFKRNPERYKGLNWLIRAYIQTEEWDKAEEFLDLGEDNLKKIPEEHRSMFHATYADYFLKKDKDFEKAIPQLESAIQFSEDKDEKRRLCFILAQINQEQRDFTEATKYYTQVLKLNPEYTMRFNARIKRAIAYDVGTAGSEDIKKELKKMLKDSKNEEFRDQIYYALAELALKEDDEPLAIDYLKKSTRYSVGNDMQKALSYLKLADIYFEQPSYVNAQTHYDSTLLYLPEEHPDYYEAESKNNSLQDLVKNLKEIDHLDSLLALANMSEKDRRKKVEDMIAEMKAEEERKKQAELLALQRAQEEATNKGLINAASYGSGRKGKWYFYNPSTMASGTAEFRSIWGNRQLEDNWRRKSKGSSFTGETAQETTPENKQGGSEVNNSSTTQAISEEQRYDPEAYLENIPVELEEQLEAHAKIAEALFNVGTIFKESFNDNPSAIDAFMRITSQYDTSQYNLPAHYQLYRIYLVEGNQEKMQVQKDWVLDNHPFSEYAYLIKNPDYNKQSKATKEKIEEYYASTYRLYDYGLYQDVIESCNKADEVFKENHIQAKFDFLKAKSIGYVKSKEEFKAALQNVVKDHSEDPVKGKAQAILDYMNNASSETNTALSSANYQQKPNEKHMFILSVKQGGANTRQVKIQLANFNQQSFRNLKLDISSSKLDEKSLYIVRTFEDEMEAMRYLSGVKSNTRLRSFMQQNNAESYIISLSNFKTLFKDKNEEAYLSFFNKKYPN